MVVDITIIIPTMNRPDSLKRTIEKITNCKILPSEVIVVDQSNDLSIAHTNCDILNRISNRTNVKYLYQEVPSLTKARNYGIRNATNEIIVCSDDDVDVRENTFEKIYDAMLDSSIAMIAGLDSNTVLQNGNWGGYLFGTKSFTKRKIGHVTMSMLGRFPVSVEKVTNTEWAMGFFFVIRKSLQGKWNIWWDEQLISYAYAEDLDFSYGYYKRCKEEGYRCIFHPEIIVTHNATQEYRVPTRKSALMYVIHRHYLAYKHGTIFNRIAVRWTTMWRIISSIRVPEHMKNLIDGQIIVEKNKKILESGMIKKEFFD